MTIKEIIQRAERSRGLVRRILRGQSGRDAFRARESSLEVCPPWLEAQWVAGACNATALWRQLKLQGLWGSRRVVREWATRRRPADRIEFERLQRVPSTRALARLLTTAHDSLSRAQTVTIAAVEAGVPALVETREIIAAVHGTIRTRAYGNLDLRIVRARSSLVSSSANGTSKDHGAVLSAITSPWSVDKWKGRPPG